MQTKLPPELQQSTFAGFVPNKRPKASLNDGWGCIMLGFLYDYELGVKQNKKASKEYYGKACDLGDQNGCYNYRKLNEQGY